MQDLGNGPLALWLQTAPATPSPFTPIWMLAAMAGIFYFLIFRPSQKQKQQQQAMLDALQPGNEVVTTGGIVGTIVSANPDTLILRIKPDNVKLQVARAAVASLIAPPAEAEKK